MSISHVQTITNYNTGAATLDLVMASMGSGNLVRVAVASYNGDLTGSKVTDTQTNTYTKVTSAQCAATGNWVSEWWTFAQAGSNTITIAGVAGGAGDFMTAVASEYSSTTGWPVNPVNTSGTAQRTSTSNPVSPDATTDVADCVVVASVTDDVSSSTYTPPGGAWTNRINDYGTTDHNALVSDEQIVTATGTYNCTWTHTSADFGVIIVAYEASGGGGAATLEQEGYRIRNDDGSESSASWKAAQDTAVSMTLGAARVRVLLDATNDPASKAVGLKYAVNGGQKRSVN